MELVKGWKTNIFNFVMLIMAVLPLINDPAITAVMPEGWVKWTLFASAIGNLILRQITHDTSALTKIVAPK